MKVKSKVLVPIPQSICKDPLTLNSMRLAYLLSITFANKIIHYAGQKAFRKSNFND